MINIVLSKALFMTVDQRSKPVCLAWAACPSARL